MKLSRLKMLLMILIIFCLVIGAFIGMAYSAGTGQVIRGASRADMIWVLFIIVTQSIAYWAYVIPYKYINKLSFRDAAHHSFEGFIPIRAKGGLNYDLSAQKLPRSRVLVSYLGLWEYLILAPAIMIAAIFAYLNSSIPHDLTMPWMFGVPFGLGIIGLMFMYRNTNLRRFSLISKTNKLVSGMIKSQDKKSTTLLVIGMLVYWSGEILALWGALQLFDINLNWFALIIAYATGYLFTRRSLPLGGAGLILITLALALHWVGASLPLAVLAAMTYQVFNLLIPMVYRRKALV